ncbi:hypothetical protein CsSME_00046496 [Camellia sinensis var. sinensis]
MGGDPTQLSFATKQIGSLCSHVSESHPQPVDMWSTDQMTGKKSGPMLSLECPFPNQIISSIKFASFGTPHGTCGSFSHGQCSSSGALSIIQKVHRSSVYLSLNHFDYQISLKEHNFFVGLYWIEELQHWSVD